MVANFSACQLREGSLCACRLKDVRPQKKKKETSERKERTETLSRRFLVDRSFCLDKEQHTAVPEQGREGRQASCGVKWRRASFCCVGPFELQGKATYCVSSTTSCDLYVCERTLGRVQYVRAKDLQGAGPLFGSLHASVPMHQP